MLSHTYQTTTQCYDPEDHNNKLHHCKNLKSCMYVDCITNDKMKKNFTFNWSSSLFACSNLLLASFNHICNSATNWLHSRSLSSPCWASAFLTYRKEGGKNKIQISFYHTEYVTAVTGRIHNVWYSLLFSNWSDTNQGNPIPRVKTYTCTQIMDS
jgi:hypothetical protein